MDSNYEWQKHHAQERLCGRLNEAQAQRLTRKRAPQRRFLLTRLAAWFGGLRQRAGRRPAVQVERRYRERPSG